MSRTPPALRPASRLRARRRLLPTIALVLACAPASAHALLARWSCWYDGEAAILCVSTLPPVPHATMARAPAHDVELGAAPPRYPWKLIRIPILTVPSELDGVRHLATVVMCGRHPSCELSFEALPDALAIAALDDD